MVLRRWYFDGVTSTVKALVIGQEAHKACVFPKSNETISIYLSVFRLPLVAITDAGDQAFEVDEEHHRHLMLWMKHLAYSKQDAETFDRTKAEEFEERFNAALPTYRARLVFMRDGAEFADVADRALAGLRVHPEHR